MPPSPVLIVDGVTGTGKSSVLRELVRTCASSSRIISEDRTIGELMSDARHRGDALPVTFPQAEAILAEIRADESLGVLDARDSGGWIIERFHPTYYSFFPTWHLYAEIDAELHRLEARMVLLSMDPSCMTTRVLERPERAGTDWTQGMLDYYGSADQVLSAAVRSQERRHEVLALTELPTLLVDTTAMEWSRYSSQIAEFWLQ